jgi:hypothetical protein
MNAFFLSRRVALTGRIGVGEVVEGDARKLTRPPEALNPREKRLSQGSPLRPGQRDGNAGPVRVLAPSLATGLAPRPLHWQFSGGCPKRGRAGQAG